MAGQEGQAVISWRRLIWLWYFWRRIAWPGWRPLVTERTLTVRASIHSSLDASFTKCFLHHWGVKLKGRSRSSLSERTWTSLLQQDYRWHIQAHCWMRWASLQTAWRGWGSGTFLSGEERWAGQGAGSGLLVVKSHLLRPWEGVVVTWDIGHYGLRIRP